MIAVGESTLQMIVNAGEVADRNYELLVNVRVVCTDCGRHTRSVSCFARAAVLCYRGAITESTDRSDRFRRNALSTL